MALYTEPDPPWQNEYVESFNGKLGDELLAGQVFYPLLQMQLLTEQHRQTYNRIKPHCTRGFRPPAPKAILSANPAVVVALCPRPKSSMASRSQPTVAE